VRRTPAPPQCVILGNGAPGKNPFLQNVHSKHACLATSAEPRFFPMWW